MGKSPFGWVIGIGYLSKIRLSIGKMYDNLIYAFFDNLPNNIR